MVFDFKHNRDWINHLTIVMQLGLTMVGSILFCLVIGFYLDRWLHTRGVFITIFIVLGVIGGAITAYRQISEVLKDGNQDSNSDCRR